MSYSGPEMYPIDQAGLLSLVAGVLHRRVIVSVETRDGAPVCGFDGLLESAHSSAVVEADDTLTLHVRVSDGRAASVSVCRPERAGADGLQLRVETASLVITVNYPKEFQRHVA